MTGTYLRRGFGFGAGAAGESVSIACGLGVYGEGGSSDPSQMLESYGARD
jgi:hypothetical protein